MASKEISTFDLLIESHLGLNRQGPGSNETTLKALSFIDGLDKNSRVADLGCGTGGQTMLVAQNTDASVVGVDMVQDFIDIFNDNAKKLNLSDRVHGIVGSIEKLPFKKGELDLIWSEGVIDSIGFAKTLSYWNGFLKSDGYVAVTCPSWLTGDRPDDVERFWVDAGSGMDSVENNIVAMRKCGYKLIAAFVLPENCWTDNYYAPREAAEKTLLQKYPNNATVEKYIADMKHEVDLYAKYKQHFGYVFYIGQKKG